MSANLYPVGTAPVKKEFLLSSLPQPAADDDDAEGGSESVKHARSDQENGTGNGTEDGHQDKKQKLSGAQKRKLSKEDKKKQRGSNKGRRWGKMHDKLDLCWRFADSGTCDFGEKCRYSHDVQAYLAVKPKDIYLPRSSELSEHAPFVAVPAEFGQAETSIDSGARCPVYEKTGVCRHGIKCRFLGSHALRNGDGTYTVLEDAEKKSSTAAIAAELNFMSGSTLKLLRTKKYPQPITQKYLKEIQQNSDEKINSDQPIGDNPSVQAQSDIVSGPEPKSELSEPGAAVLDRASQLPLIEAAAHVDSPDVPLRAQEKRRLNWTGQTYLAPLTTVGNLPFRRLCVEWGADITCGEMGLAHSFLAGSKEEWSLVRRHPSEKMFGVQVAGSKPSLLVPTAEVIAQECKGVDFVDLNCGCPIDLVFRTGSGSALLDAPGKLGRILVGMNRALGEIPLTVKLRTGVKEGKNTAHKLMPRVRSDWHVSAMTLHGRTRQQRYTKLADWDYIRECVESVRALEEEKDLPRLPIFGGGDCYSAQDYWDNVEKSGVDGVMVARGALIKPWIFTEIKERREWDISSRERLDGLRKYAEYGLDHFGTDTAGVNTTRRYLCEAISFQYRYVPLGLLEHIPGRINDRAPLFRGRDELETLLASPNSRDWVKISEMFLGPAPEGWTFTPKHKSNAYGGEEGQG